jgi:thymidylate synthase
MYNTTIIEAETLAEAWEKACITILTKGYSRFVQAEEYKIETKDLPLMIKVKQPFKEPRLHSKSNLDREAAEQYSKNYIHGMGKEQENQFDYTYYSRLRCYPDCKVRAWLPSVTESNEDLQKEVKKISPKGKCIVERIDQVKQAIDLLKKDPTRRTVVMHTWIPYRDLMKFGPREGTSSPCLVLAYPQLVDGKLHMFVVMKTNDLYNAWPGNAFAFSDLQKHIADQLGVETGTYTHFSVSMHIYKDMYEEARKTFNLSE